MNRAITENIYEYLKRFWKFCSLLNPLPDKAVAGLTRSVALHLPIPCKRCWPKAGCRLQALCCSCLPAALPARLLSHLVAAVCLLSLRTSCFFFPWYWWNKSRVDVLLQLAVNMPSNCLGRWSNACLCLNCVTPGMGFTRRWVFTSSKFIHQI